MTAFGVLILDLPPDKVKAWSNTITLPPVAIYKGLTYAEWEKAYLVLKVTYYDYLVSYGVLMLKLPEPKAKEHATKVILNIHPF